ncbi:GNAT family N-acetyltransferase [Nocardiopsis lucentensis]|uniref:GNAT family N-acetyltransferase n=1 Tax=Nocardiopsis lucentensis TaxID=53441 RepID=UPI00373AE21C
MKVGVCVPTRPRCPELRHLNCPPTLHDLAPGYRVARWDHPRALSARSRDRLHITLRDLAERAFGADHSGYWHTRVQSGFFDRITTLALILGPDDTPVGWGGYHRLRLASRRSLYLDAAGVVPAHRRFGLSTALMTHFLTREVLAHPLSNTYVVLRTRHPAVYAGWRRGLGTRRVFPDRHRALPSLIRRLAGEAAEWLGDGPRLHPDTLVVRDAYRMFDGDIYGIRPRSGDTGIDDYFDDTVGPKDAVLVVARTNVHALARVAAARRLRARLRHRTANGTRPAPDHTEDVRTATPTGAGASGLLSTPRT